MKEINTHNLILEFGKHKGERWTRIPISYLKWLINVGSQYADVAKAELDRRGVVDYSGLELSGHAVDRASLSCRKVWHETSNEDEGLYSWLMRVATEALDKGQLLDEDSRLYLGMKFVYSFGELHPTLKTIIRKD